MEWYRLYLLAGLVGHKLLWEVLKRRQGRPGRAQTSSAPSRVKFVKAAKLVILVGVLAQTVLPEPWPISREPLGLRLLGTALFTAGLLVAVLGRLELGKNWSDIETAQVTSEQRLIHTGIYRYIRHPIYVGDLVLLLGLELALNSWLFLAVVALMPVVLRQARREEKLLAQTLPGYASYCQQTKAFIPFVL